LSSGAVEGEELDESVDADAYVCKYEVTSFWDW
jgi:hypothetical protein